MARIDVSTHSLSSLSYAIADPLHSLLPDLRNCILANLSLHDVAKVGRVCKTWYALLQREDFWRYYAITRLGLVSIFDSSISLILTAGVNELEAYYAWLAACRGIPLTSVVRRTRKSTLRLTLQMAAVMVCAKYVPEYVELIEHLHYHDLAFRVADTPKCTEFLTALHWNMVMTEPILGLAASDMEHWCKNARFRSFETCLRGFPILRLVTSTGHCQGGAAVLTLSVTSAMDAGGMRGEFIECGFATPAKLHVSIQGVHYDGATRFLKEMQIDLDWSKPWSTILGSILEEMQDKTKALAEYMLNRGGQELFSWGTASSPHKKTTENWLYNPYWTRLKRSANRSVVEAHSAMDSSREEASNKLQITLMTASRSAITASGLPLLNGGAASEVVKILDCDLAVRMRSWLAACTKQYDLSNLDRPASIKKETYKRRKPKNPNKVIKFACRKKHKSKSTLHVMLMVATKRALKYMARPLLLRWRSTFSDLNLTLIRDFHEGDTNEEEVDENVLASVGKYRSMLLHVPPDSVVAKSIPGVNSRRPLPCHSVSLQYLYLCCELAPYMAALLCNFAIASTGPTPATIDLETRSASAAEAMRDLLRVTGVAYLIEELDSLLSALQLPKS